MSGRGGLLRDDDPRVRIQAAGALDRIGDDAVRETAGFLVGALRGDAEVAAACARVLGARRARVLSALLKGLETDDETHARRILELVNAVLGPNCDWYQLNLTQAVRLHPGRHRQIPHRDEEIWPCQKNGIEYLVNVVWALSDFTARNGATLLWPRSQFNRLSRELDLAEATAADSADSRTTVRMVPSTGRITAP